MTENQLLKQTIELPTEIIQLIFKNLPVNPKAPLLVSKLWNVSLKKIHQEQKNKDLKKMKQRIFARAFYPIEELKKIKNQEKNYASRKLIFHNGKKIGKVIFHKIVMVEDKNLRAHWNAYLFFEWYFMAWKKNL